MMKYLNTKNISLTILLSWLAAVTCFATVINKHKISENHRKQNSPDESTIIAKRTGAKNKSDKPVEPNSKIPLGNNVISRNENAKIIGKSICDGEIQALSDDESFLMGVKKHDEGTYRRFEYPKEKLKDASTTELLSHFFNSPEKTMFILQYDGNLGVKRALQISWTLQEAIKRKDFASSVVSMYKSDDVFPANPGKMLQPGEWDQYQKSLKSQAIGPIPKDITIESFCLDKISMSICCRSQLLLYPACYSLLKGHERELLNALMESAIKMQNANKMYYRKTGKVCYSAPLKTGGDLALRLLKDIDNKFYCELSKIKDVNEFYAALDKYLK